MCGSYRVSEKNTIEKYCDLYLTSFYLPHYMYKKFIGFGSHPGMGPENSCVKHDSLGFVEQRHLLFPYLSFKWSLNFFFDLLIRDGTKH